ncbi:MAG: S1/P1 Nuclease [Brevundimonas sp.]|uniref:S1/P1 Nuclease n=1 Tax=Brevundimonas sp. TaxID=1871086 RepID=UPI00271A97FB|nr:S1/P1 Nuclease [Brevundimonas sp.]MDO9609554.1 S1/P1 Nuclease [Brevundimonas sp.]
MKRLVIAALALVAVATPAVVDAWGNTGHRLIGIAAMRALPADMPAFLKTPGAIADVGELAREPDRWKGAGQPHDRERDTAHFIDLDDQGRVFDQRGMALAELPRLKSDYDTALTQAGLSVDVAGYLPYAMIDAWQNLGRDFAYWRVLNAAEKRETNMERQAWYRADRLRREALILRDIGVMGHYVGDGSQPHHTTIHYNGWGEYPNPEGFTNSRQTHGQFEGAFASRVARLDTIEATMPAADLEGFDVKGRTVAYLTTTLGTVVPFYRLEKAGGFRDSDPRGAAFVNERLAAGAAELRDFIAAAWIASADASIGWPAVKVAEVEAGTTDPWIAMVGED